MCSHTLYGTPRVVPHCSAPAASPCPSLLPCTCRSVTPIKRWPVCCYGLCTTAPAASAFTDPRTHLPVRQVGADLQHNVRLPLEGREVGILQLVLRRVQLLLQRILGVEGAAVAHQRVDAPASDLRPNVCLNGKVADAGGLQQRLPPAQGRGQAASAGWWLAVRRGVQCKGGMYHTARQQWAAWTWHVAARLRVIWELESAGGMRCGELFRATCILQQCFSTMQRAD